MDEHARQTPDRPDPARNDRDDDDDADRIRDLEPGVRDVGRGAGDLRTTPARRTGLLVAGAIIGVLGLIGVGVYASMPRDTPVEGNAQADYAFQGGLIIVSAILVGIGALLLMRAWVLRRRAQHGGG
ncbi:hypothetical protein [Agromyces sp. GXS1127]|uniref:hypothetical protein n=1 Tax=Agromyces sp. GXS1127 TaxID=3424181 RepID=UPI003D30F0D5